MIQRTPSRELKRRAGISVEVDPVNLGEDEWAEIRASWNASSLKNPPLPPMARNEIAAEIAFYRARMKSSYTSLETKRKLKSAENSLKKLKKNLQQLLQDETFRFAGRFAPVIDYQTDLAEIDKARMALDQVEAWLQETQLRLPSRRGRKSSDALKWYFFDLMRIHDRYGAHRLRRSIKTQSEGKAISSPSNPFIRTCAKIADPKLPKSRINTTLINAISMYRRAAQKGEPGLRK